MRGITSDLTSAHLKFLQALSRIGRRELKLSEWPMWDLILRWSIQNQFASTEEAEIVRSSIQFCSDQLGDTKLLFHLSHGDFTPWNIYLKEKKISVVDWEDNIAVGLPFFDIVHFTLRKRSLLEKRPLSLKELFSSTPRSLGIDEWLSKLTIPLPLFGELSSKQNKIFEQVNLILCFVLEIMRDFQHSKYD
jgi:hypothetical protein